MNFVDARSLGGTETTGAEVAAPGGAGVII